MRTLVAILLGTGLVLQPAAITLAAAPQLRTGSSRIVLATIVDGSGRSMVDFAVDDFVVTEAGRERDLLDVHIADYPVLLLLDDGADASRWPTIAASARRFINRIGERPIAIGTLTSGALLTRFEDDRADQLDRLERLEANPDRPRVPLAAAGEAISALQLLEPPFSAIVVIAGAPIADPSPAASELLPAIVASGTAVHVVQGPSPERLADPSAAPLDVLKLLAEQTRGQFTPVFSPASYSVALDRLADRLSAEMMIEFLVPEGAAAGEIRVGVRRPGARVVGMGVSPLSRP